MSGKYWDVRTCSWQGEADTERALRTAAEERAPLVLAAVPDQLTAAEAEQLVPPPTPA